MLSFQDAFQEDTGPSVSGLLLIALLLPEPPSEYELPLAHIEKGPSQPVEKILALLVE